MKITVLDRAVEAFESTWDGVTKQRERQWAQIDIDGLITSFQLTQEPGKSLKPGPYELDATSFGVANGRLQLSRVVLRAAKVGSKAA